MEKYLRDCPIEFMACAPTAIASAKDYSNAQIARFKLLLKGVPRGR
jgi:hypothetical protein